jgi:hypothetical protein
MLANALFSKLSSALFVHESKQFTPGQLGPNEDAKLQDIAFILTTLFSITMYQVSFTLLSKSMKNSTDSRAVTFLIYSLFGSVGVLTMDKFGGMLSEKQDTLPFLLTLFFFGLLTVLLVVMGFCCKVLKH